MELSRTHHVNLVVKPLKLRTYIPQLFGWLGSLFNLSKAAFSLWQGVFLPFCCWRNRRGRRQRENFSIHHHCSPWQTCKAKTFRHTRAHTNTLTHAQRNATFLLGESASRMWLEVNSEVCKAKEEVAATMRHMMKRTGSDSSNGCDEGEGGGGGG